MAPTSPNSCAAASKAIKGETQRAKQQQEAQQTDADLHLSQRQKQILQEARSSSAAHPTGLRVYRGNWRGAQEHTVIKQMIGDLKPEEAMETMKKWADQQPDDDQSHHQAMNSTTKSALGSPSMPVEEVVSNNSNVNDFGTQKIVFPTLFKQLAGVDHQALAAAAAADNKDNSTGVLVTRDYLSNFGKCSDAILDDGFLPPRQPYSSTAVNGGEASDDGGGGAREIKEYDFLEVCRWRRKDEGRGGGLNLSL